jgi:DNA-binding MarR family transcriptional regulator
LAKERLFFTGSTRIINDPRPSGLDFRVYACVSLHDGMSLMKGTGRGCYATYATLTAEIGCDAANLSRSLKRLVEWGYLKEERQTDRRRKTYRLTFESAETWQSRQQSAASGLVEIVGNALSRNGRNPPQTDAHYSSLKGLYPLKEKLNSSEEARFAAREAFQDDPINLGAELGKLERAIDGGEQIDRLAAYEWIGNTAFVGDHPDTVRQWALRISDKLVDGMTPDEEARWRAAYGLAA